MIYIARDYQEDVRYKFALLLRDFCEKEGLRLKIFASLGAPAVFGDKFHREIAAAKIAINFNRDDELECARAHKLLGASDRMAQFLGCGVCTFSPKIAGFERLYEDGSEIVYFDDPADCFSKIKCLLTSGEYVNIARCGRAKTLKIANAARVAKFMLETIFEESFGADACGEISDEKCSESGGERHDAPNGRDKNERGDFYSEPYEWREFVYKNGEKFR